jgi:hypothetical protein
MWLALTSPLKSASPMERPGRAGAVRKRKKTKETGKKCFNRMPCWRKGKASGTQTHTMQQDGGGQTRKRGESCLPRPRFSPRTMTSGPLSLASLRTALPHLHAMLADDNIAHSIVAQPAHIQGRRCHCQCQCQDGKTGTGKLTRPWSCSSSSCRQVASLRLIRVHQHHQPPTPEKRQQDTQCTTRFDGRQALRSAGHGPIFTSSCAGNR